MNKYIQKGFTLIEILIVITIIGVLVGFLLPNLTGIGGKTNDIARKKLLGEVVSNVEMFYLENGSYPAGTFCIDGENEGVVPVTPDETTLLSYFGNNAPSQAFSGNKSDYCTVGAVENGNPNANMDRVYYQKLDNTDVGNYAVYMMAEDSANHDHEFSGGSITDNAGAVEVLNPANPDGVNVMVIVK